MYKLNENSDEQGRIVFEQITKEYDCVTEDGTEFTIQISDSWNGSEFWTDLQEDGSVGELYQPEYDSDLHNFIQEVLENN